MSTLIVNNTNIRQHHSSAVCVYVFLGHLRCAVGHPDGTLPHPGSHLTPSGTLTSRPAAEAASAATLMHPMILSQKHLSTPPTPHRCNKLPLQTWKPLCSHPSIGAAQEHSTHDPFSLLSSGELFPLSTHSSTHHVARNLCLLKEETLTPSSRVCLVLYSVVFTICTKPSLETSLWSALHYLLVLLLLIPDLT